MSAQCTMHMLQTKQLQLRFVSGTQIQWNEQKTKKIAHICLIYFDSAEHC